MIHSGVDPVVISRLTSQQVEQVTCIECCKYYIAPETANCGHTLCHSCWAGRRSCPICAAPLDRKALKLNIPMRMLTEHVHGLGDAFERVFGLKLDEFSVDMLENNTDKDPTKNVKQWLASSQNHFSAPILSTQQSTQDIADPIELSTSKIQIHEHNKDEEYPKVCLGLRTAACPLTVVNAPLVQEDWDKIEILADTEENIPKTKQDIEFMDIEPVLIDDNEYTTENPRRSSRKRDVNSDIDTHTRDTSIDKQSLKNSSCEIDLKLAKAKQNWSSVKKMRKEFSKLNKKNNNKLNVSIEMCKKSAVSKLKPVPPVDPINLSQHAYKIDDNTPAVNNETVAVTTKDTMTKVSADLSNYNNQNATTVSNVENNKSLTDQSKKPINSQHYENDTHVNVENIQSKEMENLTKNNMINELSKYTESNIKNNLGNSSMYHKMGDGVKITQTEIDPKAVSINTDDIEISIKIGNTVTNILIKKKEKDVQLKVNTDREIQTSLGPYALSDKNDACCSPIREIKVNSVELEGKKNKSSNIQLSKSTLTKKNTETDDTVTAQYEITESVEKELSDLMECVETDNAKSKDATNTSSKSIQTSKSLQVKEVHIPENVNDVEKAEDIEPLNDLDIFGSGSVKEVNVQFLKTTKYVCSEILPTLKIKKLQKVPDKRNRDINDETKLPKNKKQKINFDKTEEMPVEVLLQDENGEVANDSEHISYDAIISQVFANIDADMKAQNKNTLNIKRSDEKSKSSHKQIMSKAQSGPKAKSNSVCNEAGNDSKLKELIHQKCSENVFSMMEKDSEDIHVSNKNVEQPPIRVSTQEQINNLLTPGICRDLARDGPPERDDVVMLGPVLGTPMDDHDDSDKSVVEETPQKNLSFSKSKKSDVTNESSCHKQQQRKSEEKHISDSNKAYNTQVIKSIISINDTPGDSKQDNTVVEINMKKKTLETPLTINNFVDHIKYNSTPVVRKSLNFGSNFDDPEETVCPTTQGKHNSEQTLCPTTTQEKEFLAQAFELTPKPPVKRPLALRYDGNSRDNNKLCLAGSCLTSMESASVKKLCEIRGWTYVDKYTNSITHLVVAVDEENKSQRSVKYMCALAASKWIVSYAWAERCLHTKDVVAELPYEVLDWSGNPGPARSRTAQRKLFEGFTFYCMPPFGILDIETLRDILEASGGRVVAEAQGVRVTPGGAPALLLAEPEHTQEDRFIYLAMELGIVPVNYEWVLNCLGVHTLCPIHELLLCPSTLLPPAINDWPAELLPERDHD